MGCSSCGSWNLRQCSCPKPVHVVSKVVNSPCTGCTSQIDGQCVFYKSATTSCLGIKYGDTYDATIKKIDTAICNITTGLVLTWSTLPLENNFVSSGAGLQTAQYSNVINTVVRLRGVIKSEDFDTGSIDVIALPVGFRPASFRVLPVVVYNYTTLTYSPGNILLSTNGIGALNYEGANMNDNIQLSLDGLSFEII